MSGGTIATSGERKIALPKEIKAKHCRAGVSHQFGSNVIAAVDPCSPHFGRELDRSNCRQAEAVPRRQFRAPPAASHAAFRIASRESFNRRAMKPSGKGAPAEANARKEHNS
jgi:hypothetical protein